MFLSETLTDIMDLVNKPIRQYHLIKNKVNWNQLCSSMDLLGDTDYAINSYSDIEWPEDQGHAYLLIYGLLQALFLQQDAVKHLFESLDIDFILDPELKDIRDIRNMSIGHPTKKHNKEGQSSHFISRITMHKNGFSLMCTKPASDDFYFREINLPDLIEKQSNCFKIKLGNVVDKIKELEMKDKEKFKGTSIAAIFPDTLSYYFEKVNEGIYSDSYGYFEFGQMHIKLIKEILDRFETELVKREIIPAYDGVVHMLNDTKYPLDEIIKYYNKATDNHLNEKDAYIFSQHLRLKFKELKEVAIELDQEFKS